MSRILTILILISPLLTYQSRAQNKNSTNGGIFTPYGDIRFLLIFAGLEKDIDSEHEDFHHSMWPQSNPSQGVATGKTFMNEYDQLFYSEYSEFNAGNTDRSISNFLFQMSRNHPNKPPLRVVADIFPEKINIKGNAPNNDLVFAQIQNKYPSFNWSIYDNRKNYPYYSFDNTNTAPDNILDYVIIIWRNKGCSGYSSLNNNFTFTTNYGGSSESYQVKSSCGFTVEKSLWHIPGLKGLFLHEISHTLFNCPHYFNANGVLGNYFYSTAGWGILAYDKINTCANAWESWYLGWIELEPLKDIKEPVDRVLNLKDFASTGDAIRIKIPYTDQNLWLEYHDGSTPFDNREAWINDGKGDPTPMASRGLYAYIEKITDDRAEIISPLSLKYANGLKAMAASGNFDYISRGEIVDQRIFDNFSADFVQQKANPAGCHNGLSTIRGNYASDTLYPNKIFTRNFTNNSKQNVRVCWRTQPYITGNEYYDLMRNNGEYTYEALGTKMAFNKPGQKMGLGSNPMIIPIQKYNECQETLAPAVLSGLSVEILEVDTVKELVQVRIKFNDVTIRTHHRFTGDLIIKRNATGANDLVIDRYKTLTVDKSGTPNRMTKGNYKSGNFEFPDFTSYSKLTIDSSARILLKRGAVLHIKEGSTLEIKGKAMIEMEDRAKIIIEKGSYLKTEKNIIYKVTRRSKLSYNQASLIGETPRLTILRR